VKQAEHKQFEKQEKGNQPMSNANVLDRQIQKINVFALHIAVRFILQNDTRRVVSQQKALELHEHNRRRAERLIERREQSRTSSNGKPVMSHYVSLCREFPHSRTSNSTSFESVASHENSNQN
jgi:hypothetical protein